MSLHLSQIHALFTADGDLQGLQMHDTERRLERQHQRTVNKWRGGETSRRMSNKYYLT